MFRTDKELPGFLHQLLQMILIDLRVGSTYFSDSPNAVSSALYHRSTGICSDEMDLCHACLDEFLPIMKLLHGLHQETALKASIAIHQFHYSTSPGKRLVLETRLSTLMMRAFGVRDAKESILDIKSIMKMFPTQSGKAMAGKVIERHNSKVATPELRIETLQLVRQLVTTAHHYW